MTDSSPSVPVESREQPREEDFSDGYDMGDHPKLRKPIPQRRREMRWVHLLGQHFDLPGDDHLTTDTARDFMALADREQADLRAERDRARDLAAHLEDEVARLEGLVTYTIREEPGFTLPWNIMHVCPDCGDKRCDKATDPSKACSWQEAPALAAHLEAEQAETRDE